jgi:predicted oxidoreductase
MRALDRLVRIGKIRYVGFSNVPAWVTARAQTLAERCGWTPLAWLRARPGTVVPIVGARRLDGVSAPVLNYPAPMHGALRAMLQFAGTTVDGEPSAVYPPLAESDVRY